MDEREVLRRAIFYVDDREHLLHELHGSSARALTWKQCSSAEHRVGRGLDKELRLFLGLREEPRGASATPEVSDQLTARRAS